MIFDEKLIIELERLKLKRIIVVKSRFDQGPM